MARCRGVAFDDDGAGVGRDAWIRQKMRIKIKRKSQNRVSSALDGERRAAFLAVAFITRTLWLRINSIFAAKINIFLFLAWLSDHRGNIST